MERKREDPKAVLEAILQPRRERRASFFTEIQSLAKKYRADEYTGHDPKIIADLFGEFLLKIQTEEAREKYHIKKMQEIEMRIKQNLISLRAMKNEKRRMVTPAQSS